jgi:hypothetical protein
MHRISACDIIEGEESWEDVSEDGRGPEAETMPARTTRIYPADSIWTRRSWLAATLLGVGRLLPRPSAHGADDSSDAAAEVQAQAKKAGLGPFRSSITEHYLGIGDAPDDFRKEALRRCGALAATYQEHFQDKGFAVTFPRRRLTVVTLKDQPTYAAFLGEEPGGDVGGHYDLDTNQLVIFDFRPGKKLPAGAPLERINAFTLMHEATHQLTFNTGLLDRQGDVPKAVSEGLAMYAELWRPDGRSILGAVHRPRLQEIVKRANEPEPWIPLGQLLTNDTLFERAATEQLAYAEAWVLVHYLLKTTGALPKFRAYLDAIRPRRTASERLADATTHLGNIDALDLALRKHAARLIQGR